MDDFLRWIEFNGSTSSSVKISTFEEYGYGLVAERDLKLFDPLLSIPSQIISTPDRVKLEFTRFWMNFEEIIERLLKPFSYYDRQDVLLAMHLMRECSLNGKSQYQAYLDLFPSEAVPRLDTFNDEELLLLDDKFLSQLARESLQALRSLYYNEDFQSIIRKIVSNDDEKCTSYSSFHKFVSISSSRSMIIDGMKHLVPFADMINHSPRMDNFGSFEFQDFHKKYQDGSITVYADRAFSAGEQIFEDYGSLDSSIFLEAHGFVPLINKFHCANIESMNLLEFARDIEGVIDILLHFQMLPTQESFPDLCIREDFHIEDKRALNIVRVLALGLDSEKFNTCKQLKTKVSCIEYEYSSILVTTFLQRMAHRSYCRKSSSLEDDVELLHQFEQNNHTTIQSKTALKFKIADKQILSHISGLGPSLYSCT